MWSLESEKASGEVNAYTIAYSNSILSLLAVQ